MMKLLFLLLASAGSLFSTVSRPTTSHIPPPSNMPSAPNIILIIGDDISWNDIGCYGNPLIRTPNIDALAETGMRFTNVYLTASSCSPSRTSILTGRYPHNTGAAELHTPLPAHLTFFPELLGEAGYFTALAGKWHEGKTTRRAYDTLLTTKKLNGTGGEEQWINLLRSRPKEKPFFFWLAAYDAHRKWTADSIPRPHDPESEVIVPPTLSDTKETRQDLASYYNEISRLDHYIGELEKELQRQGIADNTIIIFMADNGRPFPGSKTRVYDRGMKTPFIMKWPLGINAGTVCESLVSSIDIAPTLLHLAGARTVPSLQGRDFSSLLTSPESDFRNYVFSEHNWHDYEAYERMVRTKDHMYVLNARPEVTNGGPLDAVNSPSYSALLEARKSGTITPLQNDIFLRPRPSEEFYDCRIDSMQATNRIGDPSYAAVISELKSVLTQWQKETGDTQPENLTKDWYHRETGVTLPEKGKRGKMPGAALRADTISAPGPF